MNNIVNPVNMNPFIKCYRIHAYLMSIIGQHYPAFDNYVLSNYLCLHNNHEGHANNYLDFHLDNNFLNIIDLFRNNKCFDIIQLNFHDFQNIKNDQYIPSLLVELLNQGYYILHVSNENLFDHAYHSKESDNDNLVLTHGYNMSKHSFMIAGYDYKGAWGSFLVDISAYLNSLATVVHKNRLNFIRAKKELEFEFNLNNSKHLLECYVNSTNAFLDHKDYDNHIFGYKSVDRTLNEMRMKNLNLANLRVILEHKRIVKRFLKHLLDYRFMDEKSIFDEYSTIERKMEIIFLRIIKKLISHVNFGDYNAEYDEILRLNSQEAKIILRVLMSI